MEVEKELEDELKNAEDFENIEDKQTNENEDTVKTKDGKKRKSSNPNQRKKIRKLLTQDKLNPETLSALQEEENRQKRLELLKKQNSDDLTNQDNFIDTFELTNGDGGFIDTLNEVNGDFEQKTQSSEAENIPQIIESLPVPNINLELPKVSTPPCVIDDSADIICISSDDEEPDVVENISDSDDDVICTGDNLNAIADNGGIHVDDAQNVKDENGFVVINVNRPTSQAPIYLSEKLSPYIKPHQIGGIRFMFDNIVESIEMFQNSRGLGCILAHAMGLGKTLQVISFIDIFLRYTTARTVLCIVPVNTLLNWINEFSHWLGVKCANYSEEIQTNDHPLKLYMLGDSQKTIDTRAKVVASWQQTGGVMLMGYEMYRQLASKKMSRRKKTKKNTTLEFDASETNRLCNVLNSTFSSIVNPGPDLVICDEGHRIKNSHAGISKVLKQIKTQRRVVLTGYPLQNNLMEYWCMVDFVRPNFLGTRQEFSNMFERPIHNGQCLDSTASDIKFMRYRSHVLFTQLMGFVQRRSHEVLKQNLPYKEEHVLLIRLSEWQKKLYNFFIKEQLNNSTQWYSLNPIKAFSICCKIWNHPDILYYTTLDKLKQSAALKNEPISESIFPIDLDLDIPDSLLVKKLQRKVADNSSSEKENGLSYDWAGPLIKDYIPRMMEMSGKMMILNKILEETVSIGDKLLLFSQSLSTLNLIEQFLAEISVPVNENTALEPPQKWAKNVSYFRLDGNTSATDRERLVQAFNAPSNNKVHLFLLSTRAGCLGINLTGANRVVVFDASWNPCHDAQAVCRVYRYGQQKTCHIYRLVTDNTMEKKIYDRQISKQGMSDRVVDKLNPIQSITRADVSKLMFYTDEDPPPVDLQNADSEYQDPVLKILCKTLGHWLTKKPFLHESLFIDNKNQRLTTAEINAAQREYNIEKQSASTCNNSRQSYSGFYAGKQHSSSTGDLLHHQSLPTLLAPENPLPTTNSLPPTRSTPLPMDPSRIPNVTPAPPDSLFDHSALAALATSGISVSNIRANADIPMPNVNRLVSNSCSQPQKTLVKTGETMYIIKGQKGHYMATAKGHIFARRSQNLGLDPGQFEYEYNQESCLVNAVFNAMTKKYNSQMQYPYNNGDSDFKRFPHSQSYPSFQGLSQGQRVNSYPTNGVNGQSPMLNHLLTNHNPPNTIDLHQTSFQSSNGLNLSQNFNGQQLNQNDNLTPNLTSLTSDIAMNENSTNSFDIDSLADSLNTDSLTSSVLNGYNDHFKSNVFSNGQNSLSVDNLFNLDSPVNNSDPLQFSNGIGTSY